MNGLGLQLLRMTVTLSYFLACAIAGILLVLLMAKAGWSQPLAWSAMGVYLVAITAAFIVLRRLRLVRSCTCGFPSLPRTQSPSNGNEH